MNQSMQFRSQNLQVNLHLKKINTWLQLRPGMAKKNKYLQIKNHVKVMLQVFEQELTF